MTTLPLEIPGFENQRIEIKPAGLLSSRELLVNGEPAAQGHKRGEMRLITDDGREVTARWKFSVGGDALEVDGQVYQAGRSMQWYEWLLMFLPLGLAAAGIMGWIFAGIAFAIGYIVFKSERAPARKILFWAGGLALALALNVLFGVVLSLFL